MHSTVEFFFFCLESQSGHKFKEKNMSPHVITNFRNFLIPSSSVFLCFARLRALDKDFCALCGAKMLVSIPTQKDCISSVILKLAIASYAGLIFFYYTGFSS